MTNNQDKAVLFDMDGVLVDSMNVHWRAWEQVFARRGIRISSEVFAETSGLRARPVIRLLSGRDFDDAEVEAIIREEEDLARALLCDDFPAMPGADELIRGLDEAGWKMAVGTSGPIDTIRLVLERLKEGRRIAATVVAADVARGKPHPEVFLKAADKIGVSPSGSVVIEDSIAGLEAARAGGFKAVALTSTFPADSLRPLADLVVDSLLELTPGRLDKLLALRKAGLCGPRGLRAGKKREGSGRFCV
ncbi:MAG: HAD family phosphatase [Planctomycetota bacterium]|jgi:beta-phosphoglucomutase|nr:HAD family phosphatase [Planctomycetota bacterium]